MALKYDSDPNFASKFDEIAYHACQEMETALRVLFGSVAVRSLDVGEKAWIESIIRSAARSAAKEMEFVYVDQEYARSVQASNNLIQMALATAISGDRDAHQEAIQPGRSHGEEER